MNALDVYQTYLAVKQHFSDNSYDYFKYHGKIRVNSSTFYTRKDRFFYEKLARKFEGKPEELRDYFACNFSINPKMWIREMVGVNAENAYLRWKAAQESSVYNFRQDVAKVGELHTGTFDELFMCKPSQHPILLDFCTNSDIALDTLIGFDIILKCFDRWNKEIDDPIVWPDIYAHCLRYRPFLRIDAKKFKEVLVKEFVS